MSDCRSPDCGGQVIPASVTDGHCDWCGLHHHRRAGATAWAHVIGPLTVTLSGAVDGVEEAVHADELRFVGRYMTIERMLDGARYIVTVPRKRLVAIVARDREADDAFGR